MQTRLWGVFELMSSKHKHDNQNRPITGKSAERCKNSIAGLRGNEGNTEALITEDRVSEWNTEALITEDRVSEWNTEAIITEDRVSEWNTEALITEIESQNGTLRH